MVNGGIGNLNIHQENASTISPIPYHTQLTPDSRQNSPPDASNVNEHDRICQNGEAEGSRSCKRMHLFFVLIQASAG